MFWIYASGWLRLVAYLEGASYLLLGVTMLLKYEWQMPQPNYYVGMLHGWLFIAYVGLVLWVAFRQGWPWLKTTLALLASLIPFGTFYADQKLFNS